MIVEEDFFKEYMGYIPPQFKRWYDIAVTDLKYLFPCFTVDLTEQELEILQSAICIQIDYRFTNQDAINNVSSFSVGKFSVSKGSQGKTSQYSMDAYNMLKEVFSDCSSLWISKCKCSC